MNTAQIFASLYPDKEVAEGKLKREVGFSDFDEVNINQLLANIYFTSRGGRNLENL